MSEEKHFKKTKYVFLNVWLGWQDSNLRVRESKSRALPLGDTPVKVNGAGDKFRTCYLQSHNLALYRLSYARHISCAPKELLYRRYAQPACTGWAKRSFLSPHFLVRPERLEPPTHGLEGRCSILLSYGRAMRIKVALKALKAFGAGDGNRTHATSLEG